MNRQLKKLVSFTAAAAVLANTMLMSVDAAYVGERLTENDFDSMVSMADKDILIENGTTESLTNGDQLVVIDEDGTKRLISLEEGITGIYTYSSTTLGQYNYLSPTPSSFSFDYFDPNYQLSTETDVFIAGIGERFALMDNEGKVVSKKYDQIIWMSHGFYFVKDGDAQGVVDQEGNEVLTPNAKYLYITLASDGKHFLIHTEDGDYFADTKGKKVSETYPEICGVDFFEQWASCLWNTTPRQEQLKYFRGDFFKVKKSDGSTDLLNNDLETIVQNCSDIYLNDDKSMTIYNKDADGHTMYSFMDSEGKFVYKEAQSFNRYYYYDEHDDYHCFYIMKKDGVYSVLDKDYNVTKTFDELETFSVGDKEFFRSGTELYNERMELVSENYDYDLYDCGSSYAVLTKDDEYYVASADLTKINHFDFPYQIDGVKGYIDSFSFDSNSFLVYTCEYADQEAVDNDEPFTFTLKYYVNENGEFVDVSEYYDYRGSVDPEVLLVQTQESGAFTAIDMEGKKLADIPEEYTNYFGDVITAFKPVGNYNFDLVEFGRYNIFSDAAKTKFSVYDEKMELLEADVPGVYDGCYRYYNSQTEETDDQSSDGVNYPDQSSSGRKVGFYKPGTGVIFEPEYDNISFTKDVIILEKDGRTQIADYTGKILEDWEGKYSYDGGTGSAFLTRLTLNWKRDNDTKTIVYNTESKTVEYTQEGLFDDVSIFDGDYAIVTVYPKKSEDDLWSSNRTEYGLLKIDGTLIVRPCELYTLSILNGYRTKNEETGEYEFIDGTFVYINYEIFPIDDLIPEFNEKYDADLALKINDERAQLYKEGKWLLYDMDGNVLYDNSLDMYNFNKDLSLIRISREVEKTEMVYNWETDQYAPETRKYKIDFKGIIDINGRVLADPMFDGNEKYASMSCIMLSGGFASISYYFDDIKKRFKAIVFTGEDLFNEMTEKYGYDLAYAQGGDLYIVQKDDLVGVADKDNNVIIPVEYTDILSFNEHAIVGTMKDVKSQLAQSPFTDKLRALPDGSYLLYARTQDNKIRPFVIKTVEDPVETTTTTVTTTAAPETTTTAAQTTASPDVTTAAPGSTTPPATTVPGPKTPRYDRTSAERGDYNADGIVDASDASDILMVYAIIQTGGAEELAMEDITFGDLDGDGELNAADASLALRYYSFIQTGGKKSFAEYMDEGLDQQ